MASRNALRMRLVLAALPTLLRNRLRRKPLDAAAPRTILVAQLLLLGDTVMLAPLLAKLRERHPNARIVLTCPPGLLRLFEGRPWGVEAIAWDVRDTASLARLCAAGPFDLALVPADNRFSWIAAAAGAARIVGFAGDKRWQKNLPITEFRPLPTTPRAFGDFAADLIDGADPVPYGVGNWPLPEATPFDAPGGPYALIHLGASSPHKLWPAADWIDAIDRFAALGLEVVLACGRGENALLDAVDPRRLHRHYPGNLDLAQYWHLIAGARLLLCPDTGIAHLARLAGTPTVALFGPGSPVLFGAGRFWRQQPYAALWEPEIACRDQNAVFEKPISWARQCWRTPAQCGNPRCIRAIPVERTVDAAQIFLRTPTETSSR